MSNNRIQEVLRNKRSRYALDCNLWDESNAPVVKIKDLYFADLTDSERQGILSDRMIEAYSTYLSTIPNETLYVLTKCELRKLNLTDITALKNHRYLQYLDLAYNNLTDLLALSTIRDLLYLDASHNKLTTVLKFASPWYLTYVNLSYNNITLMENLQEFWSIVRLDLSHNTIEKIGELQNFRYLRYLNLSYNLIETVENLHHLNIQELNLEYNYIKKFRCANEGDNDSEKIFSNLRTLLIGHNRLSSLKFFHDICCLRLIDLNHNKISDLMELTHLRSMIYQVDLTGNPCTKWPNYKEVLLHCMPSVMFVDGAEITVAEKVSAAITFEPPTNLLASRGLTKLILLEQLNAPVINHSVIPYDESSPPLIILSGPSAVKKLDLGLYIADKYHEKVKYSRSHTTREFSSNSADVNAYYFVEREEFNEMARNGEFLTIEEFVGDSYGFHKDEVAQLKIENKIGITQMDLQASIQLKSRNINAKIILVLTKNEKIHKKWIEDKFRIFTWIKDSVENFWALTINKRQSEPYIESVPSKIKVITDVIDDIIENIDIPLYSINVRPQDMGSTTTNIILQSRTMLPKMQKTRRELLNEKRNAQRHIQFAGVEIYGDKTRRSSSINISEKSSDLKVILDEQMNIIIDDEESKRKRKRAKMLKGHIKREQKHLEYIEEVDESQESSISNGSDDSVQESFQQHEMMDDAKSLMNNYIKSILKSRQLYIDQHLNNPGFYSRVIYTDDFNSAVKRLKNYIKQIITNFSLQKRHNIPEINYLNNFIIPEKIDEIVSDMKTKKNNTCD